MAKTNEGNILMIKAVIFDMDGTVVDTTRIHDYPAWRKALQRHGITLSFDHFRNLLGKKASEIIKELLPYLNEKEIEKTTRNKDIFFSQSLKEKGLQTIPGLLKIIKYLKSRGYSIALATGARAAKVNTIKEHIPLDKYFSVIITSSEVKKGKPYPDLFLKAAEKLGVKPHECLVIEDANNGIKAASNAGMRCIAITTTHKRKELKNADKIIDSFNELRAEDLDKI